MLTGNTDGTDDDKRTMVFMAEESASEVAEDCKGDINDIYVRNFGSKIVEERAKMEKIQKNGRNNSNIFYDGIMQKWNAQ